jgi:outer membrane protein, heavy metal efflux system
MNIAINHRATFFVALLIAVLPLLTGCRSTGEHQREKPSPIGSSSEKTQSQTSILPGLDENSTISDYLKYAALNNPGLEASFNRWKAALEKATVMGALADPKFNYAYYIENVETRVGPQEQKFGISQMFPWFGKLKLRKGVAAENAKAARERYEGAKLGLFYRVKNSYYEYYYLKRAIAITRENAALLKYLENVARTRYATAGAGHPDVIRAQVELGKIDNRLRALIDMEKPVVAEFNAVLNRPVNASVAAPDKIIEQKTAVSDETLMQWAVEHNPELKALDFEVEAGRKGVKLAGKNYYPDFMLGLDYIETDEALMPTDDSGKDPVIARVSVDLPIWFGKYHAASEAARQKYYAAKNIRVDKEKALEAKVAMAIYQLHDAERKIDLFGDTLAPKAEQALEATESSYTTGKAGFIDLIDAQRTLLEFQLAYERAMTNHAQKLAQLEMLVGKQIPTTNN